MKIGIRLKLLLVLMTVMLVAFSASSWFTLEKERENVLKEINHRGNDITRFVAKSLAFSVIGYDYHTIQLLLDEIVKSKEISYAQVFNSEHKSMGISGVQDSTEKQYIVTFEEPILLNGGQVGRLTVGLDTFKTITHLENQKLSLIVREAIIILLIALAEFIALSFIIINPVKVISNTLDKGVDDSGKIVAEIPLHSNDEFGQLALKFNELGRQLNVANYQLQEKIDLSDEKLLETNVQLKKQSEELRRINEEFRLMSVTDSLTGLYNRRHFEELIRTEMTLTERHGDENSLLIIDIDNFKAINDNYGHFTGDTVLKHVAHTLQNNLRKTDTLCRVGGEEFVILCKRANIADADFIAEKLRAEIEAKAIKVGEDIINVTVSIGAATIPDKRKTKSVDDFYRYADTALYYCKEHGRNRYMHYENLHGQPS